MLPFFCMDNSELSRGLMGTVAGSDQLDEVLKSENLWAKKIRLV